MANIAAPALEGAVAMEDRNQVRYVSADYPDARAFIEEREPHHTKGA